VGNSFGSCSTAINLSVKCSIEPPVAVTELTDANLHAVK
jgi:hypothetical protein